MIKVVLVEDDVLFATEVSLMLDEAFGETVEVQHFSTAIEVEQSLRIIKPDVMIVDVVLEDDRAGILLAESARQQGIPVIFMTSYQREDLFRLALKVDPDNYLHKPFRVRELKQAVHLAVNRSKTNHAKLRGTSKDEYVLLKAKNGILVNVHILDIRYLEAFGNYCHFYLAEERLTQRMPLKRFRTTIQSDLFVRIHRNFVINIAHLTKIDVAANKLSVGGTELPIGLTYKADLLKHFPGL